MDDEDYTTTMQAAAMTTITQEVPGATGSGHTIYQSTLEPTTEAATEAGTEAGTEAATEGPGCEGPSCENRQQEGTYTRTHTHTQ